MNKNKFFKISLLAIIFIILVIGIVLIVNSLNTNDDKKEKKLDISDNPETFEGKILEIKDENVIVVEVTETGTNLLDNGEKITLKVGEMSVNSDSENDVKHEMQIGDSISTQFWKEDFETVDGGYYLDLDKIGSTLNIYL